MKYFSVIFFSFAVVLMVACQNQENNPAVNPIEKKASTQATVSVIYHSIDGGETWESFDSGIPKDATVSSFLVEDDKIFATTDYHGIYLFEEGEALWKRIDKSLPAGIDINAVAISNNTIIIGTLNHGILLSKNGGQNWDSPATQIEQTSVRCLYKRDKLLLAGTDNGIYKSVDEGNTWEQLYNGVQVNGFTELSNHIYAALMNGAVLVGENNSEPDYIYTPLTLHDISNDGERLYAMTLGDGLLKSANSGKTWENANNGLGTNNLYTFELKRFGSKIFAAQWYGIYASDNLGESWSLITNGLPDSTAFSTLEVTPKGLIAGIGLRK